MIIFCQLSHAHHNRISCYGGQKSDSYQIISSNFSMPIKSKRVRRPWSDQIFAFYTLKRSCQKSVTKVLIALSLNNGKLSALSSSHVLVLVHCPSKLESCWEKQSLRTGGYTFFSYLSLHLTYQLSKFKFHSLFWNPWGALHVCCLNDVVLTKTQYNWCGFFDTASPEEPLSSFLCSLFQD